MRKNGESAALLVSVAMTSAPFRWLGCRKLLGSIKIGHEAPLKSAKMRQKAPESAIWHDQPNGIIDEGAM
jgi:hypothetical protein